MKTPKLTILENMALSGRMIRIEGLKDGAPVGSGEA
jgi:hypothetical protein